MTSECKWLVVVPERKADKRLNRITARTKSEARARVKAALGIGRKGRLPIGTFLSRKVKKTA